MSDRTWKDDKLEAEAELERTLSKLRKAQVKRKLILGGATFIVVGIVILEKRRVDGLIEMSQAAVYDTMMNSFDEGVKYGMQLAKETGLLPTSLKEMHELHR